MTGEDWILLARLVDQAEVQSDDGRWTLSVLRLVDLLREEGENRLKEEAKA